MAVLHGETAALTKALGDKEHQLSGHNRNQFGTKTDAKTTRRVADYVETPDIISGDVKEIDSIGPR